MSTLSLARALGVVFLACKLLTNNGTAQFMLSPVAVAETGLGTFSTNFTPIGAMIDHSGINVAFQSGTTAFDGYFAPPNSNFSKNADKTKWQSEVSFTLPFGGTIDFDLGGDYKVSKAAIWNVSVKELAVQVASSTNGPWQDAGRFTLSDQQSSLSLRAAVMDFGMELQGRFARLEILSEYPATSTSSFGYVTIGEVVFRAASVGPSPMAIRLETNGDVTITFSGVLQSGNDLKGSFDDVPGNPQGIYTIPQASLAALQFFRTRN